ncbi:MAG: leucyl/phenylalanyl-tRNA--protein transferase [Planctomycetia bacterium]|nr:leucyl/phenylalanyl-tRNA--protein transferase [Planctomycetia bacterium]
MVVGRHREDHATAPRFFPPPEQTDAAGLVGIGGELAPEWLLDAYRHGIFPWPLSDGLLAWWSPDPRAVIEFDRFHPSRRLLRTCRSGCFEITMDRDFSGVIAGCATAQDRSHATWLTPAMQKAYIQLNALGVAHSVEAWCSGALVGGVYGVAIGGYFAAESMFYRVRDASKVALVALARHLEERGYLLLDIQQLTPHTERMGASLIPREEFLARLAAALQAPVEFASNPRHTTETRRHGEGSMTNVEFGR